MTSNKLPSLDALESRVISATHNKHHKEMDLITRLLNTYIDGFNLVGSFTQTSSNEVEYAWIFLVTRSFHSMICATKLIQSGYYSQAMSLLRTVTEDWFICRDCQKNPKTLQAILYEKYKLGDKKQGLTYYEMAKRGNALNIYQQDYRFQSRFTHSTSLSLGVLRDPKTGMMRTAPIYDDALCLSCCEMIIRNAMRMTEFIEAFLSKTSVASANSWRRMAGTPVKEAADWLTVMKQKYDNRDADTAEVD